jgi:hypothetical protein
MARLHSGGEREPDSAGGDKWSGRKVSVVIARVSVWSTGSLPRGGEGMFGNRIGCLETVLNGDATRFVGTFAGRSMLPEAEWG